MNNWSILVHLKPPIAHGSAPSGEYGIFPETLPDFDFSSEMLLEHGLKKSSAGSISAITDWPYFGDYLVACFR
jgi:hypothetical protein